MLSLKRSTKLVVASGLVACVVLVATVLSSGAAGSTLLGTAQSFVVLGGSTVTNTGNTTVEGNLGVSPGSAVTGFPPGLVTNGTIHITDGVASQAQSDVTTAYNTLAGMACNTDLTSQDLGGLTLTPGVYCFSSSAQLTGMLTLDAQGDPDAVFAFQIGTTLTTASNSSVLLIGGSVCTVYWQVGSSATLGTGTAFAGNILALQSITLTTGATIAGRALARNGAVTMDTNDVSAAACITQPVPTATPVNPGATATTIPATATETPNPRTPTAPNPTATTASPATASPQPSVPEATSVPGTLPPNTPPPNTQTPNTEVPGTLPPNTPTLVPTVVSTAVPPTSVPTTTVIVPIPGPPSALTATAVSTIEETVVPTASAVDTRTPVATVVETSVPSTQTAVATVTATTVAAVTATAIEITQTPAGVEVTSIAEAFATPIPVPPVSFPNTGSGGLLGAESAPLLSLTNLVIAIGIIMLMTGSLGFIVERRGRP